jgi:hypothetical protein
MVRESGTVVGRLAMICSLKAWGVIGLFGLRLEKGGVSSGEDLGFEDEVMFPWSRAVD